MEISLKGLLLLLLQPLLLLLVQPLLLLLRAQHLFHRLALCLDRRPLFLDPQHLLLSRLQGLSYHLHQLLDLKHLEVDRHKQEGIMVHLCLPQHPHTPHQALDLSSAFEAHNFLQQLK